MNKNPNPLPEDLRNFAREAKWTFAKTIHQWPHEYTLRDRVDEELFDRLVRHIRANGHEEAFYTEKYIYFEEDGLLYWTMGEPIEETDIINQCRKESSYECRLKNGTLP
jgi:hypothetical protein